MKIVFAYVVWKYHAIFVQTECDKCQIIIRIKREGPIMMLGAYVGWLQLQQRVGYASVASLYLVRSCPLFVYIFR